MLATCLLIEGRPALGETGAEDLPSFKDVKRVVVRHFAKLPGYEATDLITRKDVAPVFSRLKEIGWDVADRKELLALVPSENDFIVNQLSTGNGRRFMRSIAKYPQAYDQLDRLSRLKKGRQTVKDLVRGPDGYKMIEYLTTEAGGANLGKTLSNGPRGKDFTKPTDKIYTITKLLQELKLSLDHDKQRSAK